LPVDIAAAVAGRMTTSSSSHWLNVGSGHNSTVSTSHVRQRPSVAHWTQTVTHTYILHITHVMLDNLASIRLLATAPHGQYVSLSLSHWREPAAAAAATRRASSRTTFTPSKTRYVRHWRPVWGPQRRVCRWVVSDCSLAGAPIVDHHAHARQTDRQTLAGQSSLSV